MRILVTGGGGFIGSHLAQELLDIGFEISITVHPTDPPLKNKFVKVYDDLTNIHDQFDVCFHLSANNDTLDNDKDRMFKANLYDPIALFHNLRLAGCRNFIYASSTAVYGDSQAPYTEETPVNPLNIYAKSKLLFDQYATALGNNNVSIIGLRFCNVYGKGEDHKGARRSMISQIYDRAVKNQVVELFEHGEQRRDWVNVNDVVTANLLAMSRGSCLNHFNEIYNIGSGRSYSFLEVIDTIKKRLQKDIAVSWIKCPFNDRYQTHTECDISKASRELGYSPSTELII